eukprot:483569-Pelagomonas_calceolata.AAC.2
MGECEGEERVAAPYPVPRTPADCSGELLLLSCGADAECLAERVVHPFRCCWHGWGDKSQACQRGRVPQGHGAEATYKATAKPSAGKAICNPFLSLGHGAGPFHIHSSSSGP